MTARYERDAQSTRARDRWIAGAVLAVLAILAAAVTGFVLDAQRAGIDTRQELRLEEVQIVANTLNTRIEQIYPALGASVGRPGNWRLTPNDPEDAEKLRPSNPQSTAGAILVDSDGVILNGSLLRDPNVIGTRFEREGLDIVLGGDPTILGIDEGLTTTRPVISLGVPVTAADGSRAGAYILEVEVAADSAFSQEVAELRAGDTGIFSYIDTAGRVGASTDETTLGRRIPIPAKGLRPGFNRLGDIVTATAEVPAARWRLVFQQTTDEFEGDVTGPVRTALLLLLLAGVIGGGVSVVALLRRLRTAREEQRRLSEMASAREEFTSIVSHELRTPVAGLLGFLQTTIDHWPEMTDDERLQAISRAHQNADRLQHLTAEVLQTTSIDTGDVEYRLEPGDLRAVVNDSVETSRHANAGRTILLTSPEGPVHVQMDADRLRQVVINLLDNAVKSSPVDAPVEVTVAVSDAAATVSVRDHGTGVPPEDRERIFEKFTRGRTGLTRGSGLGLYLAREIVSAHGGRIWVDDVDGAGTAMRFSVPTMNGAVTPR